MTSHLRKAEWEVRAVPVPIARLLVQLFHYAQGTSNTAIYRHGLFRVGDPDAACLGVAWWLAPTKAAALATNPDDWTGVLSLSRLVIVPGCPTNAASFLLSRSRKMIDRQKWPCLVTYADSGQGHTGAIYRADNWVYIGTTKPERRYTIRGRMTARKAGPISRSHNEMLALGAVCSGPFAKHKFVHLGPLA